MSLLIFLTLAFTLQLAQSASDPCDPQQIHISLSDAFAPNSRTNNTIKVIFHTQQQCSSAYISLQTPQGTQKISATSLKYFTENYNVDVYYKKEYTGGNYTTYVHTFDFPQLPVSQTYQYTCYGTEDAFLPKSQGPFKFYLPSPKNQGQETSVVMFGDMDHSKEGMTTVNRLGALAKANMSQISAYAHVGDMAYNLPSNGGQKGDDYMKTIQQFTANIPYMVTAGNHEYWNNFSNFNMRFQMPMFEKSQNHYYSFNIGNMHFTSFNLDLILDYPNTKKNMLLWLEQDLKQANLSRKSQPWIIAYTHRPIYCSHDDEDCQKNPSRFSEFEDLLNKYNVDLLVGGHVHVYERSLPVKKGKIAPFQVMPKDKKFNYIVNPTAPIHIVQGMAGHRGDLGEPSSVYKGKAFSVKVDRSYSYMSVKSGNSTHLLVENWRSDNATVNDFFYIVKSRESVYANLPYYKK